MLLEGKYSQFSVEGKCLLRSAFSSQTFECLSVYVIASVYVTFYVNAEQVV